MLERLKAELTKRNEMHEQLVSVYDSKVEAKQKIENELVQIEKDIIHNQGAMKAINDLGIELMDEQAATQEAMQVESISADNVEIVE